MKGLKINGGNKLFGSVRVTGAKNSVLPILAAAVLNSDNSIIYDCPHLSDVENAVQILEHLGLTAFWNDDMIYVNSKNISSNTIPDCLMRKMRSSVIFLGSLLSRTGSAVIGMPGGCEIGSRPIDLHIKAFKDLGVKFSENGNHLFCTLDKLKSSVINLEFASVGATENIMLLSAKSDAEVVILNAAREPEIIDLQNFLNGMGANISGAGTAIIKIHGVNTLSSTVHTLIPDRITAVTYACAAAACGGDISIENTKYNHISVVMDELMKLGVEVREFKNSIRVKSSERLSGSCVIQTAPYPDFPTDAQPIICSVLCTAEGRFCLIENVFENRFKYIDELVKMGADITYSGKTAIINGASKLCGNEVTAKDLRGGAALVIAGLSAEGETRISGYEYILRGYENLAGTLSQIGAEIEEIEINA